MNRQERRRGKWNKFCPRGDYRDTKGQLDEGEFSFLMMLVRSTYPEADWMGDEDMFNATVTLIDKGFLDLYFRVSDRGVEIHHELKIVHGRVEEHLEVLH